MSSRKRGSVPPGTTKPRRRRRSREAKSRSPSISDWALASRASGLATLRTATSTSMLVIAVEPVTLVAALDEYFAWMLGDAAAPMDGLRLPPDGVDSPEMLRVLRAMSARLRDARCEGSWLIVAGDEVVGLCGYKLPPSEDGKGEIGYGIARGRHGNGYASHAVRAMLEQARNDASISTVTAATATANLVSQQVLERNGFVRTGTSYDPDDGELIWWRRDLFEFYRSA